MTANEWRRKYGQGKKPEENSSSNYSPARGETASAADEWRRKYGHYADSYRAASRQVKRYETEPAAQAKVKAKGKDRSWEEAVADYTAEEEKPNFWQRLLNIGEAAIAGTGADYASWASTWREAGMSPSEDMVNIALDNYLREQAREQMIIDEYEAGLGEWTEWDYEEAKRQRENLQFYIDAYSKASGVEAQAPELFRRAEEELTAVSAEKTAKAKQGLGTAGQFLVDAGVAGVQMLADTATGGGATAMPSMMARVFGGKAREGREKGYTVQQQVATGAAAATITYLTEMLGENPLMGEHGSLVDDIIERYLAPSSPAVAKLMNIPAQSIGEGLEEVAENILTELSDYLIVGDRIEIDPAELGREGLIGAALGGAGQVVNTAATEAVNAAVVNPQTKKIYGEPEAEAALVQEALSLNPKSKYAQRLQKILDSGEHLSGNQLRQLAELNESAAARAAETKRAETIEEETPAEVMAEDGETVAPAEDLVEAEEASEAVPVLSADEEARRVMDAVYKEGQDRAAFEQAFTFAREIGKGKGKREYLDSAETLNVLSEGQKDAAYETGRNEANRVELPKLANVEIEDGQTMLVRQDGQKISADEAYVPGKGGRDVVEAVSTMDLDGKAALSVLRGYSGKVSSARYVDAMQEAYRQGRVGVPVSAKSLLPKAAQTAVYEAGVRAGEAETEAAETLARSGRGKRAKGGVRLLGMEEASMKGTQKAGYDTAKLIGQALGANITMVEGYNRDGKRYYLDENGEEHEFAGGGKNLNGWYNQDTGEIYLDVNAGGNYSGTVLFTLAHEMTHFIKQWSPAKYRTLSGYLFEQLAARGENVETLIQRKMAATGQSYEVAAEEVVADAMETILVSGNVAETIAEIRQKDASLADKILQFLKDFVAKLKASLQAYRGVAPDSTEGRMVAELEEDVIRKLEQLWAEAAVEAGDAYSRAEQALETGNLYSARDAEYLLAVETGDMIAAQRIVNAAAEDAMPNSKIRDKDGKLLPVYHGTKDLFYTFDTSIKGGANGTAEGFGIYTTDNPEITAAYGDRQIKMYANITKPASSEQKTINRRVLAALIKDTCERQARQMVADDEYDSVEDAIMDTWVSNYVYTYGLGMDRAYRETADAIIRQNDSDMDIVHEIMSGMAIRDYASAFKFYRESLTPITGIDGIATKWHNSQTGVDSGIYLAFESSQLKSADPVTFDNSGNVIPLSERFQRGTGDIRFSVRQDTPNDFNPDGTDEETGNIDVSRSAQAAVDRQVAEFRAEQDSHEGVMYSERDFAEQVDEVLHGTFDRTNAVYVGETPTILQKVGLDGALPMLTTAKHIRNAIKPKDTRKHHHGLTESQIKSLPQKIASPVMVMESLTNSGSIVVVTDMIDPDKSPVIVTIAADGRGMYNNVEIDTNFVTSYYGRDAFNGFIADNVATDTILYINRKKATALSAESNTSWFEQLESYDFDVIIRKFREKVNNNDRLQARPMESVSNRALLANALDSAVQNEAEQRRLDEYRAKIDSLNEQQARLEELNAQIREKSFARGPRDTEGLNALRSEKVKTQNRINTLDGSLLRLEATKPLRDLLERQKASAYARAREEGRQALADYRAKADERLAETKKKYQEQRAKTKEARQALAETKKKYREKTESRHKTAMRHKIQKVVGELNHLLLHGTKDKHVMLPLQKAVAEALDIINMDTVGAEARIAKYDELISKTTDAEVIAELEKSKERVQKRDAKLSEKLALLKAHYAGIKNSDDPLVSGAYDEVVATLISNTVAKVGDTSLRDMSMDQLESVYKMYAVILKTVRDSNKVFRLDKTKNIQALAADVMQEVDDLGVRKKYSLASKVTKMFTWDNLKPVYAFSKIGSKTLARAFDNVRSGEDTWAKDIGEAVSFREKTEKKYGFKKWDLEKRHEFTSSSGERFELTLDQIMSLYAYSKRDQAEGHLANGGIVLDDSVKARREKTSKSGKRRKSIFKYSVNTGSAWRIDKATIGEITGVLTDEQIAYVDEMQKYLSETMGEKGNEVSREMYGINLFGEGNYFPLKSAKQFMFEQTETAGEVRVKNSGFSKEITPGASNPIILSNFTDVWANHVNDMSMYHAFVLPLEDFNRVFNYAESRILSETSFDKRVEAAEKVGQKAMFSVAGRSKSFNSYDDYKEAWDKANHSVKSTIQNAYGANAVDYVRQLITDLNGGARSDPSEYVGKALVSRFKKSAVSVSLSVVIQQPSAVARALALIDAKYFDFDPKIVSHKKLWAEVKKYAPVAMIKEMGRFDTDVGQGTIDYIKGTSTLMEKMDDFLSTPAAYMDELTWCHIWTAVKRETIAKHKGLKYGSEAFLEAAGKRFTEVVVKTQVYDSVMARSGNMRSKSWWMGATTSFMAEPTTSLNMFTDSFVQQSRGYKKTARKARASVIASIILNAALSSLVYAARDDDEDETWLEKYTSSFLTELIEGINPATYIPIVKDVWSLALGYDVERSDMTLIATVIDALQSLVSVYGKYTGDMDEEELAEHNKKILGAWASLADAAASLSGIPLKNLRREGLALLNVFRIANDGIRNEDKMFWNEVVEAAKSSIPVWSWFSNKTKKEMLLEAAMSGDDGYLERVEHMYDNEQDKIETAARSAAKTAYQRGEISQEDYVNVLVSVGGKTREEAETMALQIDLQSETGDDGISVAAVEAFEEHGDPAGVDWSDFWDVWRFKNNTRADVDEDGNAISGSAKAKVLEYIDGLAITDEQKDALYFAVGWSENTLDEAPWH